MIFEVVYEWVYGYYLLFMNYKKIEWIIRYYYELWGILYKFVDIML